MDNDSVDDPRFRYLRACDRCRRRKIKCDSAHPCTRCVRARSPCTFDQQPHPRLANTVVTSANPSGPDPSTSSATSSAAARDSTSSTVSVAPSSNKRRRLPSPSAPQDDSEASSAAPERPPKTIDGENGEPSGDTAAAAELYRTTDSSQIEAASAPSVGSTSADAAGDSPLNTSHFYLMRDGSARWVGSTSGLPLLDAARQQLRVVEDRVAGPEGDNDDVDPDWSWLSSLLKISGGTDSFSAPPRSVGDHGDETEYFPGVDSMSDVPHRDLFALVSQTIPVDLQRELFRLYFAIIHPVWPILHPTSFYASVAEWDDANPAFAALAVAVCMLASRYSSDLRVRADPNNPASAGMQYYPLFGQLRDMATSHVDCALSSVQATLLASQFHCVDNVPHSTAQSLFGEAYARCMDGGLHREMPNLSWRDANHKESRRRTAWACYVFDKQLATVLGRPPIAQLWDIEIAMPAPFSATATTPAAVNGDGDSEHVAVFSQAILLSGVLEKALAATSRRPIHDPARPHSDFLSRLSVSARPDLSDEQKLDTARSFLNEWSQHKPSELDINNTQARLRYAAHGVLLENLSAMELTIQLILAGRRLQLATPSGPPTTALTPGTRAVNVSAARQEVLDTSRQMVALAVQLGSAGLLAQSDIMLPYRVLLAGRMILAVSLSARSDGDLQQQDDATSAVQAATVILHHLANVLPISLGCAETFDETCRVCGVLSPPLARSGRLSSRPKFAWYRPVTLRTAKRDSRTSSDAASVSSTETANMAASIDNPHSHRYHVVPPGWAPTSLDMALYETPMVGQNNTDVALGADLDLVDFEWLFPGGLNPPPAQPSGQS